MTGTLADKSQVTCHNENAGYITLISLNLQSSEGLCVCLMNKMRRMTNGGSFASSAFFEEVGGGAGTKIQHCTGVG